MDIIDIVKNTKRIYMSEASLETIMDFERVLDSLDIYAFANWKKGELIEGPILEKHWVECTFMWPLKSMPDPDGGKRLTIYRAKVSYSKDDLLTPMDVKSYDDFRSGTKKPKMRKDRVWLVKIRLPIELIKEFRDGFKEVEGEEIDLQDIDHAYETGLDQTELTKAPSNESQ